MNSLEWTILGLLADGPRSGYVILKVFRTSPAVPWRASSGSVYPALRRLVQLGFAAPAEAGPAGGRRSVTYTITGEGQKAFQDWLEQPVGVPFPEAGPETLIRMLFIHHGPPGLALRLLEQYRSAVQAALQPVEAALTECDGSLPPHHRLCLLNGQMAYAAQLRWIEVALSSAAQGKTQKEA